MLRRDESGAVLAFAVLLSVALLALGHALLVTAEAGYVTSRARVVHIELDVAAENRIVDEVVAGWRSWVDSVPPGGRRRLAPARAGVLETHGSWRRMSEEAWLIEATASRSVGPTALRRRAVWMIDPLTRAQELPAVVTTGPGAAVGGGGTVTGDTVAFGIVDTPALGLLSVDSLLSLADSVGERGRLAPEESAGACDASAMWNWGDPARPHRACGSYVAVKGRGASLELEGGSGQAVLVVRGDLTLGGGVHLEGVVIATGIVTLREGSSIVGRVVAFDGFVVEPGSRVVGSKTRAAEVLGQARRALGIAIPLHGAARLGPD